MSGYRDTFFRLEVITPVVRCGADEKIMEGGHTLLAVYCEMLIQICRDYHSLPDPRTLSMTEIRFFYEALRSELRKHTTGK